MIVCLQKRSRVRKKQSEIYYVFAFLLVYYHIVVHLFNSNFRRCWIVDIGSNCCLCGLARLIKIRIRALFLNSIFCEYANLINLIVFLLFPQKSVAGSFFPLQAVDVSQIGQIMILVFFNFRKTLGLQALGYDEYLFLSNVGHIGGQFSGKLRFAMLKLCVCCFVEVVLAAVGGLCLGIPVLTQLMFFKSIFNCLWVLLFELTIGPHLIQFQQIPPYALSKYQIQQSVYFAIIKMECHLYEMMESNHIPTLFSTSSVLPIILFVISFSLSCSSWRVWFCSSRYSNYLFCPLLSLLKRSVRQLTRSLISL